MEKRHPRDPFVFGRVRVQLRDAEGRAVRQDIANTRSLLRKIAENLPSAKSRLPDAEKETPKMAAAVSPKSPTEITSSGGVVLVARKKSGRKK